MLSNELSSDTLEKLKIYEQLLRKWQKAVNIVSKHTMRDAWVRHFEDSIQLSRLIKDDHKIIYDLGSGGGFPGMVLAILYPEKEITCVESDAKKCSFLKAVIRETGIQADVKNERIEIFAENSKAPDLITARALASIDKLIELSEPWVLNKNTEMLLLKGRTADDEVKDAKQNYSFKINTTASLTDNESCIVSLSNISACE